MQSTWLISVEQNLFHPPPPPALKDEVFGIVTQFVVNKSWNLDKVPSISVLHRMFYSELRRHGSGEHHVKQIYVYAKAVVKASKQNGRKKPVLSRLTARIDRYDYKLDMESGALILKLHGGKTVKLRVMTSSERVEKYRGWSN
ncbi:MAG: hypothetical protein QXE81_05880 [Desulfurococcaceae archaeon]